MFFLKKAKVGIISGSVKIEVQKYPFGINGLKIYVEEKSILHTFGMAGWVDINGSLVRQL